MGKSINKRKNWVVFFCDELQHSGVMSIKEYNKLPELNQELYIPYKYYKNWEKAQYVADKHAKIRYNIT